MLRLTGGRWDALSVGAQRVVRPARAPVAAGRVRAHLRTDVRRQRALVHVCNHQTRTFIGFCYKQILYETILYECYGHGENLPRLF